MSTTVITAVIAAMSVFELLDLQAEILLLERLARP
jgi:hypothetical protein